jgi:hypothetical protein
MLRFERSALAAVLGACFLVAWSPELGRATDIEREPIRYSQSVGENPVTQLQAKLDQGLVQLEHQPRTGWLRSLLEQLQVPVSSQTLVYSKTSLQRQRISPTAPRALYFNDDIYVGYCRGGSVLEISVADPRLGTEFYTLSQDADEKPKFLRQNDECLICHASSATQSYPGHLLRSVLVDHGGNPILSQGSYRIDATTPWQKRFGGWLITHPAMDSPHMGNQLVVQDSRTGSVQAEPWNVDDVELKSYLTGSSDWVAHLLLAHQTQVHNRLARLTMETQLALADEKALNRELKEPEDKRWESTTRRIRSAASDLVASLLFRDEADLPTELASRNVSESPFAVEFQQLGPTTADGRSLRELDLKSRLMKYPCSYLIYTNSFRRLPAQAKSEVIQAMQEILVQGLAVKGYERLSLQDRQNIVGLLVRTLPEEFGAWKQ